MDEIVERSWRATCARQREAQEDPRWSKLTLGEPLTEDDHDELRRLDPRMYEIRIPFSQEETDAMYERVTDALAREAARTAAVVEDQRARRRRAIRIALMIVLTLVVCATELHGGR